MGFLTPLVSGFWAHLVKERTKNHEHLYGGSRVFKRKGFRRILRVTSWLFCWLSNLMKFSTQPSSSKKTFSFPRHMLPPKMPTFSWVSHVLAIRQWTKWVMWFAWSQLSLFSLRSCYVHQRIPNPKWVNLVGSPKLLLTNPWLKYN